MKTTSLRFKAELPALSASALLLSATLAAPVALAEQPQKDINTLDAVTVLGAPSEISEVPGSAQYVDNETLEEFEQADVMRVLRQVPGVYVQEEEGYGLRPNIGIRGSGLDRSSRIAVLEDGILIAPAPYAAPSAYYFPTMRRMYGMEVLKGPSAVRLGARTTGGALNLISTPIPSGTAGTVDFLFGSNATSDLHAWYGEGHERGGILVEAVKRRSNGFKDIDGGGDTGFRLGDFRFKARVNSDPTADLYQSLELKLGRTTQTSHETYLGLTDADFAANPNRRYAASRNDRFDSQHNQIQLTYGLAGDVWDLSVALYRNTYHRDWYKLERVNGKSISSVLADPITNAAELSILRGDTDSAADALGIRHNNRRYYSQGIQSEFGIEFNTGRAQHNLEVGVRFHRDEEDRFQDQDGYQIIGGQLVLTTDAAPGTNANRVSDAEVSSIFFADEIKLGNWLFAPGVRFEQIELTREDYATTDPSRSLGPTRIRTQKIDVTIPGMGVSYRVNSRWLLLAGIHKGFNPPGPGSNAEEEESVNSEIGFRFAGDKLSVEMIAFHNAYSNLVGTCTASTGGGCTIGDQFDGGEATVVGLEMQANWAVREWLRLGAVYTFTQAEFDNSFSSGFGPWQNVQSGDAIPYIPEHQLQVKANVTHGRWGSTLAATYVDAVRTIAGQGSMPANESTESAVIVDWALSFALSKNTDLFLRVDNVFDETYIAARRPAGVRPGKERTALVGFRRDF